VATRLYFDNNATTAAAPEVLAAMWPFHAEHYGNPSSLHSLGDESSRALSTARAALARLIGAGSPARLVFTSGATEANATALASALANCGARRRILTTAVEHPAVLEPLAHARERGFEVVVVGVDGDGRIDRERWRTELDERTALVSVMAANNETGVIHAVEELVADARRVGASTHVDAVQACGKLPLDCERLGADFVAVSAHKLHGPKGVGALYVRRGVELVPFLRGGPQEDERRGGTENVPAIVGFGKAAALAREWLAGEGPLRLAALRDRLEAALLGALSEVAIHGRGAPRLANTTNLRVEGVSGEALVMLASDEGLCASTGAACSASRHRPSHVLLAMGLSPAQASSSVRLSLSRYTTEAEVDAAAEVLVRAARRLRAVANPLPTVP
jgi:cysteine desulfurase